jgi:hypothetical protein
MQELSTISVRVSVELIPDLVLVILCSFLQCCWLSFSSFTAALLFFFSQVFASCMGAASVKTSREQSLCFNWQLTKTLSMRCTLSV